MIQPQSAMPCDRELRALFNIFVSAVLILLVPACRPTIKPELDMATSRYLEQFRPFSTKLVIEAVYPDKIAYAGDDEIVVRFSQPIVPLDQIGITVHPAPLTINPPLHGSAWWENPRTLVFRTDQPFGNGERYIVTMPQAVEALTGAVLLAEREFSFIVIPRDRAFADTAGVSAFQPSFRLGKSDGALPFDVAPNRKTTFARDAKGLVTLKSPPTARPGDRFTALATVKNPGRKPLDLRVLWQAAGLKVGIVANSQLTLSPGEESPVTATLEVLADELKSAGLTFHRDNAFAIATDVRFLAEGKGVSALASIQLKIMSEPEKTAVVTGSVTKERSHVFVRTRDMDPNYGGLTIRLTCPAANRLKGETGDDFAEDINAGRVMLNGHEVMHSRLAPMYPIDELFLPMAKLPEHMTLNISREEGKELFYELSFNYAPSAIGGEMTEKGASLTRALFDSTGAIVRDFDLWSGGIYEVRLSVYLEHDAAELKIEDYPAGGVQPVSYSAVADAGADFTRFAAVNLHPRVYSLEEDGGRLVFVMRGVKAGLHRFSYYVRAEYPGLFSWPQARIIDRASLAQTATTGVMKVQIR